MVRERTPKGRVLPRILAVAMVGLIPVACNDDPPEDAPEMDPQEEMELPDELQEAPEPPQSPDAEELSQHELTVEEIERWANVQEQVAEAFEDDPELPARIRETVQGMDPAEGGILSLDEQAEVVESEDAYRAAVEGEGMTPREFARTAMVFSGAYTLYEVEQAGEPREVYEQEFPWVADHQVEFVRENHETLEPLLQRYLEATQRMEGADPEAAPPADPEPQPPQEG